MRGAHRAALVSMGAALCSGGALGLAGCTSTGDCAEDFTCGDVGVPRAPCDDEGVDPGTAPALDRCGVFVGAHGDDDGLGTREHPMRTLQRAITRAELRGLNRVYACGDTFEEAVTLPSGVDLWGGRDCAGGDWLFGRPDLLTTIAPRPVGVPLQVIAGKGGTSTVFGVRVVAADGSAGDGKSSIAMIVHDFAKVTVLTSEIHAGDGKTGEPGEDAPHGRALGTPAHNGENACTADLVLGGAAAVTTCDDGSNSIGGRGGDGGVDAGSAGAAGEPAPVPNPLGLGRGGRGEGSATCSAGTPGGNGANGADGGGAMGLGGLTVAGWVGVKGQDGMPGIVGQGGGGGGGGQGGFVCTGYPRGGASGGSGGGGGCGGKAGKGGGFGGASIGIVALHEATVSVDTTLIVTGRGGDGGVGGTGQPGGRGYPGGLAGLTPGPMRYVACDGGVGGNGGNGGNAGGGMGGPSIGIASLASHLDLHPAITITLGSGGIGGNGGNPNVVESRGHSGFALPWYPVPLTRTSEPPE